MEMLSGQSAVYGFLCGIWYAEHLEDNERKEFPISFNTIKNKLSAKELPVVAQIEDGKRIYCSKDELYRWLQGIEWVNDKEIYHSKVRLR